MLTEAQTRVSMCGFVAMLADFDCITLALDRNRTWTMFRTFKSYLDAEGRASNKTEAVISMDRTRTRSAASQGQVSAVCV